MSKLNFVMLIVLILMLAATPVGAKPSTYEPIPGSYYKQYSFGQSIPPGETETIDFDNAPDYREGIVSYQDGIFTSNYGEGRLLRVDGICETSLPVQQIEIRLKVEGGWSWFGNYLLSDNGGKAHKFTIILPSSYPFRIELTNYDPLYASVRCVVGIEDFYTK